MIVPTVGILLITHSGIGSAFLNVVRGTFVGKLPLEIAQLSVSRDPEPQALIRHAANLVFKLDSGEGVLVLTDIFGSTPSNISQRLQDSLQDQGLTVSVVAGLNLPMLFSILNYPQLLLPQLARKAVEGAQRGIFEPLCKSTTTSPTRAKHNALHLFGNKMLV